MSNPAKFWDKIANKYARSPIADEKSYQKKLQITREYFSSDSEVLEIGCGTGSTAILHAPYVKHIRATDISAKMIEIANEKLTTEQIDNITFEQAAIDDLKIEEGSLDVVMAHSILHLVDDKDAVIEKAYQWLKPGGVLVTSTVCLGDYAIRFLKPVVPIAKLLGFMPSVKVLTAKELEVSMINAGFTIGHYWKPPTKKITAVFIVGKKPA